MDDEFYRILKFYENLENMQKTYNYVVRRQFSMFRDRKKFENYWIWDFDF